MQGRQDEVHADRGHARFASRAIIEMYQRDFGATYERNEVMGTSGGKQAIFNAVVSLINPDDEVLIPKPYWVTFLRS
jgi:aspartate aminotransferase